MIAPRGVTSKKDIGDRMRACKTDLWSLVLADTVAKQVKIVAKNIDAPWIGIK